MRDLYQIVVHAAYGCGSVILRHRCDNTSVFVDDIMFLWYNDPYSGMNFRYKGPILVKFTYLPQSWTEFNFILLKGIIFNNLFRNY